MRSLCCQVIYSDFYPCFLHMLLQLTIYLGKRSIKLQGHRTMCSKRKKKETCCIIYRWNQPGMDMYILSSQVNKIQTCNHNSTRMHGSMISKKVNFGTWHTVKYMLHIYSSSLVRLHDLIISFTKLAQRQIVAIITDILIYYRQTDGCLCPGRTSECLQCICSVLYIIEQLLLLLVYMISSLST